MRHWWDWGVAVVLVLFLVMVEGKPDPSPLSHQQQLRRRGIARGRSAAVTEEVQPETTEPILVEYTASRLSDDEREKKYKVAEKAIKAREQELEKIKQAFYEREKVENLSVRKLTSKKKSIQNLNSESFMGKVLEEREYALDVRDSELDQRSNNIDKQILETDNRLKEREGRIAAREKALSERESEILKLAEMREQEIARLSMEREYASELREKALEDREKALDERERRVAERETRVAKRMEANRKRFERRRELAQLDQRIGMSVSSTSATTPTVKKSRKLSTYNTVATTASLDQSTQASSNHPKRVVEKVTLRKVTSTSPVAVSEATVFVGDEDDGKITTALSPDEQFQVTEAVSYESAKEFGAATSPPVVKGETTVFQQGLAPASENSLGEVSSSRSGKKRKSGKRRARQRRQGHHDGRRSSSGRKHKVRKVVKRMGSDGTMVIISKHDH